MNVLAIDIGGTHVKIFGTGQKDRREFESGPKLTPRLMVAGVKKLAQDWKYDVISIGYPGPVLRNRPVAEPHNLAGGWVGFDFEAAFKRRVRIVNDAAMQALGSYRRGKLLFLGLGTGLGTTLIVDGIVEPMELGHLPYRKATYEDYVGSRGLKKHGKKKWRKYVADVVERLIAALEPDDIVLGGGNVTKLKKLPKGCRAGDNANAFLGGFRLWRNADRPKRPAYGKTRPATRKKAARQPASRRKPSKNSPTRSTPMVERPRRWRGRAAAVAPLRTGGPEHGDVTGVTPSVSPPAPDSGNQSNDAQTTKRSPV